MKNEAIKKTLPVPKTGKQKNIQESMRQQPVKSSNLYNKQNFIIKNSTKLLQAKIFSSKSLRILKAR